MTTSTHFFLSPQPTVINMGEYSTHLSVLWCRKTWNNGCWMTINISTNVLLLLCLQYILNIDNTFSESMAKGDFDNLKGAGKPLPERRAGAHAITDFTRHKVAKDCDTTHFIAYALYTCAYYMYKRSIANTQKSCSCILVVHSVCTVVLVQNLATQTIGK